MRRQARGGLIVFQLIGGDEGVERGRGILAGLGHPDFLQGPLGLRLLTFRQFVENIGGLVHPAALLACGRPQLAERLPEAKRTVGDGEFGRDDQTSVLQIEQHLAPILGALAGAIGEAEQRLPALRGRADDDQDALLGVPARACR